MRKQRATTYTLRIQGGISGSTVRRMRNGESISTNTIEALCSVLKCDVKDIIQYLPDPQNDT
jgi:DNA-binding Xre family transcriptional regulator